MYLFGSKKGFSRTWDSKLGVIVVVVVFVLMVVFCVVEGRVRIIHIASYEHQVCVCMFFRYCCYNMFQRGSIVEDIYLLFMG